jgi:formylglycine-generating enzyme required for sulfatase activity
MVTNREAAERMMSHALPASLSADTVLDAAEGLGFLQVLFRDSDLPDDHLVRFRHQRWMEFWAAMQMGFKQKPDKDKQRFTDADWRRFLVRFWWESDMPNRADIGKYEPLPPPPLTGWEEVVLMLAGIRKFPDEFVRDVLRFNPIMAARCIHEGRANVSEPVRQEVIRALLNIIGEGDAPAELRGSAGASPSRKDVALRVRIAAGEALGYVGDTRFRFVDLTTGQDVTSDELKARIWRGDNPEDRERYLILPPPVDIRAPQKPYVVKEKRPASPVTLRDYAIGKYPVTYREFEQFVSDEGYTEKWRACWTDGGWDWLESSRQTAPYRWNDSRFHKPNSPVVGITWFEAVAYCNWLNAKVGQWVNGSMRSMDAIDAGMQGYSRSLAPCGRYRLPTEAEWEYAAAGDGNGRLWAWGDEPKMNDKRLAEKIAQRCNARLGENYVSNMTPVGIYLLGATPDGIFDMAGNVWEWCSSLWDEGQEGRGKNVAGNPSRVLRGGAWLNAHPLNVRAALRLRNHPDNWWNYVGFRCACVREDSP